MSSEDNIPFKYLDLYPDALGVFQTYLPHVNRHKDDALIVLDTNTLLAPYSASQHSLEEIKKLYEKFKRDSRLIVPGHVAREFASNRTDKLKDIHSQLTRQKAISISIVSNPILEDDPDYQDLKSKRNEVERVIKEYKAAFERVIDKVTDWRWNDPVSIIYRDIFDASVIYDIEINRDQFTKEMLLRAKNKMPPGYKDGSKKENSAGDLIIWQTILKIGEEYRRNVIFVTHDGKPDWWSHSEGSGLYPRFELIDEYRRKSGGCFIYIMKLSEVMKLFDVDSGAISELVRVEKEADSSNDSSNNIFGSSYATASGLINWIVDAIKNANLHSYRQGGYIIAESDELKLIIDIMTDTDLVNTHDMMFSHAVKLDDYAASYILRGKYHKILFVCLDSQNKAFKVYMDNKIAAYPEDTTVVYCHTKYDFIESDFMEQTTVDKKVEEFVDGIFLPF